MGLISGNTNETVTVKRKTSHGLAGDPIRGTTLTMPARIEREAGKKIGPDGTELFFDARVFTEPPNEILVGDLLFFPEDSTATDEAGREVVRADGQRDLDGVLDHYEVHL